MDFTGWVYKPVSQSREGLLGLCTAWYALMILFVAKSVKINLYRSIIVKNVGSKRRSGKVGGNAGSVINFCFDFLRKKKITKRVKIDFSVDVE